MLARRETAYICMPNKIICYFSKHVYGKELFYFVNNEDEILFHRLTGRKTIQAIDIVLLRQWNILFELVLSKKHIEAATF